MRDHILKVAEDLFYQEGIRAVGIDRIIADAGVAKSTLYAKFTSKQQLVVAYLTARSERIIQKIELDLAAQTGSGRERILFLFDELQWVGQRGSPFRGCAFMLALGEAGDDPEVRAIALRHKGRFREIFTRLLGDDYAAPADLAQQIAVCYEGALTMIALMGDTGCVRPARRIVETILDAAEPA